MVMSKYVLIGFMGTALLVFAYSCVYLAVIRNTIDRNGKNKIWNCFKPRGITTVYSINKETNRKKIETFSPFSL